MANLKTGLNHIDLFTGIGGFTLACHWNYIDTEVMCEKDDKCKQFLEQAWPGIPIVSDIREFDGTRWRGRFLLTGGVPCQPASRAGKQGGKADERWLWPEAIRVVGEGLPTWCLFENPPGIYDVGIDGILSDMEGFGYETGIIEIPACAVNAPQIRQRVWIVAHSSRNGKGGIQAQTGTDRQRVGEDMQRSDVADTQNPKRFGLQNGKESEPLTQDGRCYADFWGDYTWLACADGKLRRAPDDTFGLVDGLHRSLLGALGNSIVPQVAYEIIKSIKEVARAQHGRET